MQKQLRLVCATTSADARELDGTETADGRPPPTPNGASGLPVELTALPPEVLWHIAHHLDPADVRALGAAHQAFAGLAHDDGLWHAIYRRMWPGQTLHPGLARQEGMHHHHHLLLLLLLLLRCNIRAWRLAVARREQSLRWVALVAEAKEPASDPRTRFDHLAELVIILAEHAEESIKIRLLGLALMNGLLKALEPAKKRPSPAVRLVYTALAYLAENEDEDKYEDEDDESEGSSETKTARYVAFGEPLREQFVIDQPQIKAMWKRQFSSSIGMSMAVSYFFASLALRQTHPCNNIKIAPSLLPLETFEESESAQLEASALLDDQQRSELCRMLSGWWRGFYFYPDATADPEMRLYLVANEDGLLAGQGADDVGSFVVRGQAQFATGLVTFSKSYERRTAVVWTYRGKLNSNGLAGTWGDVRWGGAFMIWPGGEGQEQEQEQLARLRLAELAQGRAGAGPGVYDELALPPVPYKPPARRPRQCALQ
ncbi:Fbox domain containing protein [Acanthamoeba castellanii str. Neff]|uniref:Fbox domain containing protein n=1 Tax=Acanthamoeba castellanii (strain ATCC 30010 / Neff) TaxID=1257118 RepID=L8GXG8_ACACF|nr:Fbox domain containing protein [Acanthamoeba castellanii str. Neff]ELR17964.1 Fbox domain containing protein [Acanthamoeba castellanii str. Neff]